MLKVLITLGFLLLSHNSFAQNQNFIWCDIAKDELKVVQQQKNAGFKINDTIVFNQNSPSQKLRTFKMQVAKLIYSRPDSGQAYLNSQQYFSDCMAISN